ncbi:PREDICTED: left-right determination factor 2 [Elephantulus edwardii]|uniref:left-right determination factor 2 n=1 Tax=Elephantulus edwardii TaxID=28737 RepID=UPI0003F0A296|nr:PREDICTED: left-right determination factor 2 [Elephantulus edwardii]
MQPLWLCWVLGALLAGPGAGLTEEEIRSSVLQQLHLSEVPVLDKAEGEQLVIPAHVRAQYVDLLQRSHRVLSRGKRFSQKFREVAGRFLMSEATRHLLVFGMEQRLPPDSELVQAVLRLFQEPVSPAALRRQEQLFPRGARARVSVEWLRVRADGANSTSLVDSRLVSLHESGWKAFDVTEAVSLWQQLSRPHQPLLLQVTVQKEHLGAGASDAHKLVRFASQAAGGAGPQEPQLELHTLDLKAYGAQGDCDPDVPVTEGTRCCRQEMYIDLQGMRWTENWILEPPGFLTYECVGSCRQVQQILPFHWPFMGPRQCVASETASLPIIVNVQEGGRTRPQVVSLPNMRVQKCSCSADGVPVPRMPRP